MAGVKEGCCFCGRSEGGVWFVAGVRSEGGVGFVAGVNEGWGLWQE